jgi:hypothetical protein
LFVAALALGIAFAVGCSSSGTSSTYLISVDTAKFISDATSDDTYGLTNVSSIPAMRNLRNAYQQNEASIPAQYLLGFSGAAHPKSMNVVQFIANSVAGCCRIYTNASKICRKSFPQNPDILVIVVDDINRLVVLNSSTDLDSLVSIPFSPTHKAYITTSKVYTGLIISGVVWALISSIFISVFASKNLHHLLFTIPGAIVAAGGTAIFTWCIVEQIFHYQLNSASSAISFGPGSFILWTWMVCVLLLTPLTAMISIIVVLALFFIVLWIVFACIVCVLSCVGSGENQKNQKDQQSQQDAAWYYSASNPAGPNYNPS